MYILFISLFYPFLSAPHCLLVQYRIKTDPDVAKKIYDFFVVYLHNF